ncbi:DUF4097 family beta strand repeat-containing protein [Acidianus brierleyi]|uniref:DUF4097 domain-containing protein n=1 Tax=Acidianus brierleyi TaxID=41673 RepID=A0A2U9IHX3_9CREN|nr:DUF4097 family beta strand repeat-containing protein [Acidianus brierleyi]AWR95534.1 DUF4097 family beta strand repeat protein [Acidianus brierleyi]
MAILVDIMLEVQPKYLLLNALVKIKNISIVDTNGHVSIVRDKVSSLHFNLVAKGLFASLNDIKLTYYTIDNSLYVYVSNPNSFYQTYSVDISIELPEYSYNNITINMANGEISLCNIYSNLSNLEISNGIIDLNSVSFSNGLLFISNGEIKLENVEANFLSASVNNGEIKINLANNSIHVIPSVNNGKIYINGEKMNETSISSIVNAHVNNGEIKIYNLFTK